MPISLSDEQRLDWLRLIRTESIGPRSFRALVNRFGSASAALSALPEVSRAARRPVTPCPREDAEREMRDARRLGVRFIALGEADYPASLQAIETAPPLLAVRGMAEVLKRPAIGIVGSRNASALGAKFAGQLAHAFAEAGFLVVSGLARGIDAAAHQASVTRGTVAALAGGPDCIYPPQHEALLGRILETGCAVSEMPMGWEPRARDFPRRNRLISGLSLGVVVVEAARGSGSLITARYALEQGRDVFAVPGSPLDPRAAGVNDLIRQGAMLVSQPSHVIDALVPQLEFARHGMGMGMPLPLQQHLGEDAALDHELYAASLPGTSSTGAQGGDEPVWTTSQAYGLGAPEDDGKDHVKTRILGLMGPSPIEVDELIRQTEYDARQVQMCLLDLELAGLILRHGGQKVSRCA